MGMLTQPEPPMAFAWDGVCVIITIAQVARPTRSDSGAHGSLDSLQRERRERARMGRTRASGDRIRRQAHSRAHTAGDKVVGKTNRVVDGLARPRHVTTARRIVHINWDTKLPYWRPWIEKSTKHAPEYRQGTTARWYRKCTRRRRRKTPVRST